MIFLPWPVVEFLRHLKCLGSRPTETRAAKFLQRGKIVQLGRSLPLFLDAHAKRAFEAPSRVDHFLGKLAPDNPLQRRVPHPELTAHHVGGGNDLKIIHRHEVPDFQLSLAHDCQGRRLHPANPDHAPGSSAQNNGRGSGQRQVVYLVGLTARYGSGV